LFSLVLAYERAQPLRDVNASYRWILGKVAAALRGVAVLDFAGTSDLTITGRKVSGNAQQRKTHCLLHHGTLLYAFDLPQLSRLLKNPEREPDYRAGRDHGTFVANLPVAASTLRELLANEFGATPGLPPTSAVDRIPRLVSERYSRTDWVRRR
jgi:lipoate-protein ligase A